MALLGGQLSAKLLSVLLFQLATTLLHARVTVAHQQLYAVVPEGGSCHDSIESCHPLKYYINDTKRFFATNVSMVFLPGDHVLQSGSVNIASIYNFQMINYFFYSQNYSNTPKIVCSNHSGFSFTNVSGLVIEGLTLVKCEQLLPQYYEHRHTLYAGLAMKNVVNLSMQNVTVIESKGLGLNAENILGHSQMKDCTFRNNRGTDTAYGGNARIIYYNCDNKSAYFSIQSSNFEYGSQYFNDGRATGLQLSVDCRCSNTTIELDGVVLRGNKGYYGGNMAVYFYNCHHSGCVGVSVLNSLVEHGESHVGGGMFIKIDYSHKDSFSNHTSCDHISTLFDVRNTSFFENEALVTGGAVCSEHWEVESPSHQIRMSFTRCNFSLNSAVLFPNFPHGGTAVRLSNYHVSPFVSHTYPQLVATFENCTFSRNYRHANRYHNGTNAISAALYLDDHPHISISNSTFTDNKCTAIVAVHSNVLFGGKIVIQNNTGGNGGGLVLCDQSSVAFKNHTRLEIVGNKAQLGGGIYIDDSCLDARAPCFFQIDSASDWELSDLNDITITMEGNNATYGTAIYGGNIDYCFMFLDNNFHHNGINGTNTFNEIFDIANATSDLTSVTSDPIGICFCSNHSQLIETCNHRNHSESLHVYPGGYIELPVVVIGQRWGTVAGSILAKIQAVPENENTTFNNSLNWILYAVKDTSCKHSELFFRIFSPPTTATVTLEIQDSSFGCESCTTLSVDIAIAKCPLGFQLNKESFECECNDVLKSYHYKCDIDTLVFRSEASQDKIRRKWILFVNGTNSTQQSVRSYTCPLHYCKFATHPVTMTISTTDEQCHNNRAGYLCGMCREGHSVVLGTPKCKKCSNTRLFLLPFFALAGLLLIAVLLACNLTVTMGTLSGFIFYANAIEINKSTFLWNEKHINARIPIAWLNLDLGIQTCFYKGMDDNQKIWLQFVFPIYLWFLTGVLIVLSRRCNIVSRLMRKDGTKLLATLFLLSYTKLIRNVVHILSYARVLRDNRYEYVWLYDGNVTYFSIKHMSLLLVSLLVSVFFIVPYTLILTCIQPMQKANFRCTNYLNTKFKPLMDAYTAPYKDTYRFWPGLLLVFRIIMFSTNIPNSINSQMIILIVGLMFLLMLMRSLHGVYKVSLLNALEVSLFLNVSLFALVRTQEHFYVHHSHQVLLVLVSISFSEFILVLFYHIHKQLLAVRKYNTSWEALKTGILTLRRNNEVNVNEESDDSAEDPIPPWPPVIRFDQYREPLIASENSII